MTARILTAAVALFAATVHAAPVPKDAKPVEHDGGTFRVTFPGKPEATSDTGEDHLGKFTKTSVGWDGGRVVYGVVVKESETNFETSYDADTLAEHYRGNARKIGTIEEERVTAVGSDVVARWLRVREENGTHLRALVFVRGNRMYVAVATGPDKASVTDKASDKFFDSLVLTK